MQLTPSVLTAPLVGAGCVRLASTGDQLQHTNQPSKPSPVQPASDQWVEVVHEASGQTYWWNQRTGALRSAHVALTT